jgi:3-(3-hydroxy-phenyl)propionate hydroxylase
MNESTQHETHAVVIAGGGPTGLMLAAELALAKIDVIIIERREDQEVVGARAGGLHSRTIEMLDLRGVAERFLSQGQTAQIVGFVTPLDISDFPTRHNYGLALRQRHIERILAEWVAELNVPVYRGREVIDFSQDEGGVDIELSDGRKMRANYLVGCDGGRSLIRKRAKIDFVGWDPSMSSMIAEVEMSEEPPFGIRRDQHGVFALGKAEGGRVGVVIRDETVTQGEPTLEELRAALLKLYGKDFGLQSAPWLSRFTDMTRQAASYRDRRIFLAGDAAHIHSPVGGQGLNLGVQDAFNLGWKLAQVVHGASPESLLDTYHAERHPVGARALRGTMAATVLNRVDDRVDALRETLSGLMKMDEPRKKIAALFSGLDIHYDLGEGHPLLGRRIPDLEILTSDGAKRVFSFLHEARHVLLNFGTPGSLDISPWREQVRLIEAQYSGTWELPVLGVVEAPAAILIRPDGYVAWIGEGSDNGLREALHKWVGAS